MITQRRNILWSLLLAPVLAFGWVAQPRAQDSHLQRILQSGELRVGTTGDFNPMSFKDPATNDYAGYDIDTVRQFASDMGVSLVFVPTDWKTLVSGIQADKYDLTTSASLSMDRAKVAGFSDPYVEFSTVPMTRAADAGRFDGWESLDDPAVTIAVTLGTVFEQQARQYFQKAQIVTVEAPAREYQEVLAGRADASVTSNVDAAQLVATYPELAVVPVDRPRSRRPGAFLLPQDDQVWINYVNHWIRLRHASGFFEELQKKWNLSR
ncbi:MAG: transporter substrate-binding domain-containing protein [Geminicoccaceae bacterium]|nr:transporter substrate-binding domain-containing protein [Geminicoccaceae bacterium]